MPFVPATGGLVFLGQTLNAHEGREGGREGRKEGGKEGEGVADSAPVRAFPPSSPRQKVDP